MVKWATRVVRAWRYITYNIESIVKVRCFAKRKKKKLIFFFQKLSLCSSCRLRLRSTPLHHVAKWCATASPIILLPRLIFLFKGYEGECIAVDFAESLIASMSVKYLHPRLRYLKNDITSTLFLLLSNSHNSLAIASLSLPASSVDIAIDRGLSDSLAASENAKLQLQEMEKNIFITCKSWCLLTHDEKRVRVIVLLKRLMLFYSR